MSYFKGQYDSNSCIIVKEYHCQTDMLIHTYVLTCDGCYRDNELDDSAYDMLYDAERVYRGNDINPRLEHMNDICTEIAELLNENFWY